MLGRNMYNLDKFVIHLKAAFKPKAERKEYRKKQIAKLVEQERNNCTWGVSYSVFDGEELLEASIRSVRNAVDYINVVYQLKSWYGNPASDNLLSLLYSLKEKGLIDELIEYKPNIELNAGVQERIKRSLGLKAAKKAGVDYFMTMDCDEFYREKDIINAQKIIIEKHLKTTFCPIFCYGLQPTMRYSDLADFSVPFFSKINVFSKLGKNKKSIALVDPTRQVLSSKKNQYYLTNICMHHMSMVRKDINKKLKNSSNPSVVKNADKNHSSRVSLCNYLNVNNEFNIHLD